MPLRQPVATNHASFSRLVVSPLRNTGARAASANTASDERGAPFSPASCAVLIARASRECPTGPSREHEQVLAGRIRHPVREPPRRVERELRTEHRGQADFARGFGEPHHAVEPVVIGERERGQPEPRRFFDQLFGMARTVEEREIRMTVQLGITNAKAGCGHVHVVLVPPTRLAITVGLRREVRPRPPNPSPPGEVTVANICSPVHAPIALDGRGNLGSTNGRLRGVPWRRHGSNCPDSAVS